MIILGWIFSMKHLLERERIMDQVKKDYERQYINYLAKLGEVELIIKEHQDIKEELLARASQMKEIISNANQHEEAAKEVVEGK